jgi:hypothetical protein
VGYAHVTGGIYGEGEMKKFFRATYKNSGGFNQAYHERLMLFFRQARKDTGDVVMPFFYQIPCPGNERPDVEGGNICALIFGYEVADIG